MGKLTKEEAIKRHRMMWNWIGDETLRLKQKVYKHSAMGYFHWESIELSCWCCEYDSQFAKEACTNCPVHWPGGRDRCCELYNRWCHTFDYKKAADLAYQIANLPEKENNYEAEN